MSEKETRDFMSVDAFSQLPFIRPSPAKPENSCGSNPTVRLFGIDFPPDSPADHHDSSSSSSSKDNNSSNKTTTTRTNNSNNNDGNASVANEPNRKFECHYCCRNFPTSQALGGHQNAHKRERQHAKRAHLQSTMAAAHQQALADTYGLVNYHRLGSLPSPARFTGLGHGFPAYPSWTAAPANNYMPPRFYPGGAGGLAPQPVGGAPLPGLWRTPSATPMTQREQSIALPLLDSSHEPSSVFSMSSGVSSNQASFPCDGVAVYHTAAKDGAKDHHLSLDLHL